MKLSDRQLASFLRHLAALLESGVPIQDALDNLAERWHGKKASRIAGQLRSVLANGCTFGGAVEQCPGTFLPVFRAMIIAGETAGKLPEIFKQIADLLDAAVKRKRLLQLAMVYPCFVILLAMALIVLLAEFVFPRFKMFYDSVDAELPVVTRSLLVSADFLKFMLPWIAGIFVLVVLFVFLIRRLAAGRVIHDYWALSCSPFRLLHRKQVTANFARALGMLEECGVSIRRSIPLAGAATGNSIAEQVFVNASRGVDDGCPLSEALGHPRLLSPELVPVLRAGEQTGTLDQALKRLADELDGELNHARRIRMVVSMLLIVVLLGIFVGWIVIAIMSAYFGMAIAMF